MSKNRVKVKAAKVEVDCLSLVSKEEIPFDATTATTIPKTSDNMGGMIDAIDLTAEQADQIVAANVISDMAIMSLSRGNTDAIANATARWKQMVNDLATCKEADKAMTLLKGKNVNEIKIIMTEVKARKDKAIAEVKEMELVKAEVESLLHATYGKPAVLPKAEVITNKTRLAVWIFQSNAGLTKPEFIAEFIRIRDELKLKFTDKDAGERWGACYLKLRGDPDLAVKYGKTYKGQFAL